MEGDGRRASEVPCRGTVRPWDSGAGLRPKQIQWEAEALTDRPLSLAVGWGRFLIPSGILLLASPHSLLQPLSVSAKLVLWPPSAPLGVDFPTALVCGSVCLLGLSPAAASGLLSLPPG